MAQENTILVFASSDDKRHLRLWGQEVSSSLGSIGFFVSGVMGDPETKNSTDVQTGAGLRYSHFLVMMAFLRFGLLLCTMKLLICRLVPLGIVTYSFFAQE